MNSFIGTVAIVALVLRVVLDLASLVKPSKTFNLWYFALFVAIGVTSFLVDGMNLLTAASIAVAVFHGVAYALNRGAEKEAGVGAIDKP